MINRVRDIVIERDQDEEEDSHVRPELRLNFMSWNASSAALGEIIEYLEELVDLTKLLVGSSEFRNGMLFRPTYHAYIQDMETKVREASNDERDDGGNENNENGMQDRVSSSKRNVNREDDEEEEDGIGKTSLSGSSLEEKGETPDDQIVDRATLRYAQSLPKEASSAQFDGSDDHEPDEAMAIRAQGGNNVEGGDEVLDDLPLPLQRITTRVKLARQLSRNSLQS